MQLVGMLDSPYVRRVAISLDAMDVSFEHKALSVFDHFDKFKDINPIVKAPTLVFDNGEFMIDSTSILQFIDATYSNSKDKSLWSTKNFQQELKIVSLALAACDKGVQLIYERNLRPKESQYEPWLQRVEGQLLAAISILEIEVKNRSEIFSVRLNQATISTVVAWTFIQSLVAGSVPELKFPQLKSLAKEVENERSFLAFPPVGPGVNP